MAVFAKTHFVAKTSVSDRRNRKIEDCFTTYACNDVNILLISDYNRMM